MSSKTKAGSLVAVVLLATGLAWQWWIASTRRPVHEGTHEIEIAPGSSVIAIARVLHGAEVRAPQWVFPWLLRSRGDATKLKAGRYRLEGPLSLNDIADLLVRGSVVRQFVTFPEGRNVFEMAEIVGDAGLSKDDFLDAARDPSAIRDLAPAAASLEGYLYPDTYDIASMKTSRELVALMTARFRDVVAEIGLPLAGGLDMHGAVTLASIVELETGASVERPQIAGVFLNRLRMGMPLQTDPTVIYALRLRGLYDGNIRKKDLKVDSPYNTYARRGLPPGPIASPGRAALAAVKNPTDTKALYFVSRNDGTHVFSTTLRDHERAVTQYQRRGRPPATPLPGP